MKISIDIDENMLRYVIGSARCEWAQFVRWDEDNLRLELIDVDDEELAFDACRHFLNREHFARALKRMASATEYNTATKTNTATLAHHFRDIISGNFDCVTGDILIQLACFGEVKYE